MHEHSAKNAFSERLFDYRSVEKRKLILSLSITSIVMIVEVVGGFLTHSIALISDAGHMFTHCFALGISLAAIMIARKPLCHHRTFGLYRAEIVAAFVNGLFLLFVVAIIIYEAILRIIHPEEVLSLHMLMIAFVGLVANLVSIGILHGSHKEDMNVRSVFYHMVADAASSVGIVIAAIVIFLTGWNIIDPLVSLGISAVIIYWAWGILKDSTIILLEMAPRGLNTDIISDDLKSHFPEIKELFNVHLWTITADMLVFSAHVVVDQEQGNLVNQYNLIERINRYLSEKYRVIESTIQMTSGQVAEVCE
ncbi:MAG TPA: cation diffusion facilitator family transporter [Desulfatiglandales bacterium]|nr:cation diffusion facilitator family transporter [Desulfatiglandales bacterium]